jgi:hypothetical protein
VPVGTTWDYLVRNSQFGKSGCAADGESTVTFKVAIAFIDAAKIIPGFGELLMISRVHGSQEAQIGLMCQ